MAAKRAKRVSSRGAGDDRDDVQGMPERAAESLTEIAAASGTQAMRLAAAIARGMARGVAGAARELRRPVGEITGAAAESMRIMGDAASKGVERATKSTRKAAGQRTPPRSTRGRASTGAPRRRRPA